MMMMMMMMKSGCGRWQNKESLGCIEKKMVLTASVFQCNQKDRQTLFIEFQL